MRKIRKRVFAAVLAAALLFTMPGMASYAEAEDAKTEDISESVTVQAEDDAAEEKNEAMQESEAENSDMDKPKTGEDDAGDTEMDAQEPAEEETVPAQKEDVKECTCGTLCTQDSINGDCPVCGAEDAGEQDGSANLCAHHKEHTKDCGYSRASEDGEGNPCTYECRICPIEDLIAALPDEVTEDNGSEMRAQLNKILALYRELTEEEQEQIDLTLWYELQEALDTANVPVPLAEGTPEIELFGQKVCSGNSGNGWSYEDGVLTLENFHADDSSEPFIHISNPDLAFTLYLKGENSVKTSNTLFYGNAWGSTTITGEPGASLSLNGRNWNDRDVIIRNVAVDVTTQNMISLSYSMLIDNATVNFNMNGTQGYIYATHGGLTIQNNSNVTMTYLSDTAVCCAYLNESLVVTDSSLNLVNSNPDGFGVYVTKVDTESVDRKAVITNSTIMADVGIAGIHCNDEAAVTSSQITSSGQFAVRSKNSVTVDADSKIDGIMLNHFNSTAGQPSVYQVFGQSTLRRNLTVAESESFIISDDAALAIPAGITLTNNGSMRIHDKASLTGAGSLAGGGDFLIDVSEEMICGTENLVYNGADQTEKITLEGNVTICGVEFTADTTGWTMSIDPAEVKEAGNYTVTLKKEGSTYITKTFTVAECPHTGLVYTPQANNKHGGICPICSTEVSEEHTWVDGTCPVCNLKAVVSVKIGSDITYYDDFSKAWEAAREKIATVTLLANVTAGKLLTVTEGGDITFDGGKFTLTGPSNNNRIFEIFGGKLTVTGGTLKTGEYTSGISFCIFVNTGELVVTGGILEGGSGALSVGSNTVKLSGGKFSSTGNTIYCLSDVTLADLRADGYAYFDANGPIALVDGQTALPGTVTVAECEHTGVTPTPNGDGTHTLKCPYCGYTGTAENCSYGDYKYNDTNHWKTCMICQGTTTPGAHYLRVTAGEPVNGVTQNREACDDCDFAKDPFNVTVTVPSGLTYGNTGGKKLSYTVSTEKTFDIVQLVLEDGDGHMKWMTGDTLPDNLSAGSYKLYLSGDVSGNPMPVFLGRAYFTVNPAPLTADMVKLSPESVTYSSAEQKPTITVKQGETILAEGTGYDVTYSTDDFTNARMITVSITGKGNYTGTVEKTYTIKKAPLTITASSQTITYGGSITQGAGDVIAAGLCSGDSLDRITLTASTANVPGGNITPSAAGIKNSGGKDVTGNYEITYKDGGLTINKAGAEITVGTGTYSKTYGDAAFTLDVTDNNTEADVQYEVIAGADVISVSNGTVTIKNAGTATITVSLPETANYNAAASRIITVNVARKGGYTVVEQNRSYLYSRENTGSIDLAALLPKDCGAVTYGTPAASGDVIYSVAPAVNNGKLSYTLNSGNINDEGTITVPVATRNYTDITVTVKMKLTDQIPVGLKDGTEVTLINNTFTYGEPLSKLVFNKAEFVGDDGNTVAGTLAWKDAAATPDAGTTSAVWVFTPADTAYVKAEGTAVITVNKAAPTVSKTPALTDRVYNPSRVLEQGDLSDITVTGVDGKTLEGEWNWQSANIVPTVNNSGYAAVFTPKDTTNYGNVTRTVAVNVTKATPYIAGLPAAAGITYGDTLNVSALSGGTVLHGDGAGQAGNGVGSTETVAGAFTWKEPSAKPAAADSNVTEYTIVFTPSDTANYNSVEAAVKLTVNKAQNAPNMLASTMSVPNSIEKVGSVPLPAGWEWQASDKDTALEVEVPTEAVAVYTGADIGNYENETVAVAITRSSCDHVYKSEVTKAATTESEGIRTYTCTRCGHSYTRPIAKLPGDTKPGSSQSGDTKPGSSQPGDTEPDGSEPGDRKPGSSQSKDTKPGSGSTEETRLEPGVPFIKGEDGKNGWDVIRAEEEQAKEGSVINVDMNGTRIVPGDIFDSIKGRDITITFDMGNGIIWSVDGRSITTDKADDIDFSVKTGGNAIPVDVVNNVTGESYSIQISLAYEGEFGFTALLSIDLGKENGGYIASLYYYNESTGELEFICADTVAEDGTASFAFTHASDYVIVVDEDEEEEESGTVMEPAEPGGQDEDITGAAEESPQAGQPGRPWWFVVVGILAVVAGAGVFFEIRKKRNAD